MAKMRAVDAAMASWKEGITAFGVPGLQSTPSFCNALLECYFSAIYWRVMWKALRIWLRATHVRRQVLFRSARELPLAGTHMVIAPPPASADSNPILCITGQAPRARSAQGRFPAVDIVSDCKTSQQDGSDGS